VLPAVYLVDEFVYAMDMKQGTVLLRDLAGVFYTICYCFYIKLPTLIELHECCKRIEVLAASS